MSYSPAPPECEHLAGAERGSQRPSLVREPLFADQCTVRPNHRRERVMLVGIEGGP